MMKDYALKPIGWVMNNAEYKPIDDLSERVITALEDIESLLSEAKHIGRYDVIHKAIKTFAALNMHLVKDAAAEWEAEHQEQEVAR